MTYISKTSHNKLLSMENEDDIKPHCQFEFLYVMYFQLKQDIQLN